MGSRDNSRLTELIDSEMAGPIKLKLGEMVKDMWEKRPSEEIFWTHLSWPGSGRWATGASSRPWG